MTDQQVAIPTSAPLRAYGVLGIGILAVSLAAILIRYAQGEAMPSLLIATARLVIASVILTPIALRRYRPHLLNLTRSDLVLAGTSGVFLAAHFATWVTSLEHTTVLISVVLVTTTPLWAGLLEVVILKVRFTRPIIIGLLIALAGGIVISLSGNEGAAISESGNAIVGSLLALAGAITVAIYMTIGRKLRAQIPVIPYIWLVYSFAAIIMCIVVLFTRIPVTGYSPSGYLYLLALGLIPQLIGHSSINYVLGYLPATYVSMATQLEPIGSAFFAFILFTEIPGIAQIVGSAIILIGVSIATLGQANGKRKRVTA